MFIMNDSFVLGNQTFKKENDNGRDSFISSNLFVPLQKKPGSLRIQ